MAIGYNVCQYCMSIPVCALSPTAVLVLATNLRLRPLAAYLRAHLRRSGGHAGDAEAAAVVSPVSAAQHGGASDQHASSGARPAHPSLHDLALDLGRPYVVGSLPSSADDGGGSGEAAAGDPGVSSEPALLAAARASGLRVFVRSCLLPGVVPPGLLPPHATTADDDEGWDGAGIGEEEEGDEEGGAAGTGGASAPLLLPPAPPFYDLEVCVRGRVFRAHRLFLCGRSRYLESALRFEQLKAAGDAGADGLPMGTLARLSLDDVSPAVFALLVEWAYIDALRPRLPLAVVAEALVASDALALGDGGLRALLVQQLREGEDGRGRKGEGRCCV